MPRKKVTLQRITNDSTRRATFRKRRKGLMKKASELATLCDVDTCVVVYGEGETEPEVWPDVEKAEKVLTRFKQMPELDRFKKTMDMEGLLTQRMDKQKEQLHKAWLENQERETTLLLHDAIVGRRPGLAGLSVENIVSLGWMVEYRLAAVNKCLERLHADAAGAVAEEQPQDNVGVVPPTTVELQMPQQVSLPPLVPPYSIDGTTGGQTDFVHQAPPPNPQPQPSWLVDLAKAGDLGAIVYSGFCGWKGNGAGSSGGSDGASTSAGAADILPGLGNFGAGSGWPDPFGAGPSSFPPM